MDATWHPVALSGDIETATSAGFRLGGQELVVWRDDNGQAHVWEDRCPHRGMRLSFGFVRGDHLACLYHGWQYDRTGRCRYVPAHPDLDVPATITVQVFRTREWAGIVWVSLGVDAVQDEAIDDIAATAIRSVYLDGSLASTASAMVERGLGAATDVKQLGQNLCLVKSGAHQMLAALQPVSATRTGIHVVLLETAEAETLKELAEAVKEFRDSFGGTA